MLDGEEKIIESAIRGKASAFGSLYDHYQPKIYRFVLIKVSRREEAEDLTHQVFLHAWQNIAGYRNLGFPFSSWLYRIARNQVIDFYRVRKETVEINEIGEDYFEAEGENLDEQIEIERIVRLMKKLKPIYQDVLMMRFVEDLPLKEVADYLGKSEGAVKLIQHRAVRELKEIIGE